MPAGRRLGRHGALRRVVLRQGGARGSFAAGRPRWIEIEGRRPDLGEAGADFGPCEVFEQNPAARRIGKMAVARPAQAEIGEQLDRVADIDHDQEGRPAFPGRQGAGIGLRLHAGLPHGALPVCAAPDGHSPPCPRRGRSGGGAVVAPLLGFQDEASALVKIDAARADRAVSAGYMTVRSKTYRLSRSSFRVGFGRATPMRSQNSNRKS